MNLEAILPAYIEITHGNHIRAYIYTPPEDAYPLKIAVENNETEMLKSIIAYLEKDVANLKRHYAEMVEEGWIKWCKETRENTKPLNRERRY